jgi:polyhydroxybutyrate depolymerase
MFLVVINLHGLTSNIDQQIVITGFEQLAEQEKFVVLTPQALGTPTQWTPANTADNADVAFIGSMLDELAATTCVDVARVYSTGISDGGIMSAVLACRMSDRIAAVGLVSGITHPAVCAVPTGLFTAHLRHMAGARTRSLHVCPSGLLSALL